MKATGTFLLSCGLFFGPATIDAQSSSRALQPLSFLSGHWLSESPDDTEEEYWSKTVGDSMVGTFRVVKAGSPVFYEFWAIEVEDGKPIFKMKHFHHGLLGWEEKNDVVRLALKVNTDQDIVFANPDNTLSLRYVRKGDDLTGELLHTKAGKTDQDTFHFHLAK